MNRKQLEHAIRAACTVANDRELYVFGSQAILGGHPEAPATLCTSIEVDVAPKNRPDAWEEIDGALGELSQFHDTFGFYVQGLEIEAATLPDGWNQRCVDVRGSDSAVGHCLEAHDLALSKLAAFREKDLTFVRTLIIEGLVHSTVLLDRLETMTITPPDRKSVIERWIKATARELPRRPR